MKNNVTDRAWQEIASIKGLLDSAGWKVYKRKLRDLLEYEKCQVRLLEKKGYVTEAELPELNSHLSSQKAIERILLIEDELADDVSTSPDSEAVHNTSEE